MMFDILLFGTIYGLPLVFAFITLTAYLIVHFFPSTEPFFNRFDRLLSIGAWFLPVIEAVLFGIFEYIKYAWFWAWRIVFCFACLMPWFVLVARV